MKTAFATSTGMAGAQVGRSALRLLQPEIDVVPGRRPQQPQAEGTVGPGSSVLRLVNTSSQENAYTVRVRCDNPYWQDDWYAFRALPAPVAAGMGPGDAEAIVGSNKPDQYGPGNRWVKVFVSAGAQRDILLAFNLPQKPDSRAGQYPFVVAVETSIVGAGAAARRGRFSEIPARAVVRPYHKWSLDVTPEDGRRVGMVRRGADFELVVTNEGNDWLYCDLKLPRPKDLLLQSPTVRLAVPPPEPGQENFQRTIPLRGVTRLRQVRGERMLQALPLSAVRVDAPSVAPFDEEVFHVLPTSGAGRVIASGTNDVLQTPSDRALVYCPPIPSTLTGFLGAVGQNAKGLLITVIALIAAVNLGAFMFENLWRNTIQAEPTGMTAGPNHPLVIAGKFLNGARVLIETENGRREPIDAKFGKPKNLQDGRIRNEAKTLLAALAPTERQFLRVEGNDLSRYNGQRVRTVVQRAGVLPFMSGWLPSYRSKSVVVIGKQEQIAPNRTAKTSGDYAPGNSFRIRLVSGPALSGPPKAVLLGGVDALIKAWNANAVTAVVPSSAPLGTLEVTVEPSDGGSIPAGTIHVAAATSPNELPQGLENAKRRVEAQQKAEEKQAERRAGQQAQAERQLVQEKQALQQVIDPAVREERHRQIEEKERRLAQQRREIQERRRLAGRKRQQQLNEIRQKQAALAAAKRREDLKRHEAQRQRDAKRHEEALKRQQEQRRQVAAKAKDAPDSSLAALSAQTAYECLLLHQWSVARTKAQQMLASSPDDPAALAIRGLALLGEDREKNYVAASGDLRRAFRLARGQRGRTWSLALLGMAATLEPRNARTRETQRQYIIAAMDADPTLVLAATTGARFLSAIGEGERAKNVADEAVRRMNKQGSDESALAAFDVALCFQDIGNAGRARELMDRFKQQAASVASLPPFVEADSRMR